MNIKFMVKKSMAINLLITSFLLVLITSFSGCKEQVNADRLQKRGDFYYTINSQKPFSGESTDYYSSGQIKEIINFKKGRPHGHYQSFYENGQTKKVGSYKISPNKYDVLRSHRHGNWKYYGDSGWLGFDTNYDEGILNGKYMSYYENGAVWQDGQFLEGEQVGEWTIYDRSWELGTNTFNYTKDPETLEYSGRVSIENSYSKKPILEKFYNDRGEEYKKYISRDLAGNIKHEIVYDEDGYRLSDRKYFDGWWHYRTTNYGPRERYREESKYSFGKIVSYEEYDKQFANSYYSETYSPTGAVLVKEHRKGRENFREDGSLESKGPLIKDNYSIYNKHGTWEFYSKEGDIEFTEQYEDGELISRSNKTTYYDDGSKRSHGPTENRWLEGWNGSVDYYNQNGELAFILKYENGTLLNGFELPDGTTHESFTGSINQYYENHTTACVFNYENGRLIKEARYRKDGSAETEIAYSKNGYGAKSKYLTIKDYKVFRRNGQLSHRYWGLFTYGNLIESPLTCIMPRSSDYPSIIMDHWPEGLNISIYNGDGNLVFERDIDQGYEARYHKSQLLEKRELRKFYLNGKLHVRPVGKLTRFDYDGKPWRMVEYHNDKIVYSKSLSSKQLAGEYFFSKKGKLIKSYNYDFKTGVLIDEKHYSEKHRGIDYVPQVGASDGIETKIVYHDTPFADRKVVKEYSKYKIISDTDGKWGPKYKSQITEHKEYYRNGHLVFDGKILANDGALSNRPNNFTGSCKFYYQNGLVFEIKNFGDRSLHEYSYYTAKIYDYSSHNYFGWDISN